MSGTCKKQFQYRIEKKKCFKLKYQLSQLIITLNKTTSIIVNQCKKQYIKILPRSNCLPFGSMSFTLKISSKTIPCAMVLVTN